MKARLEEAILGTIGARQEMVRRSRGEREMHPTHIPTSCSYPVSEGPQDSPCLPLCPAHLSQREVRTSSPYTWVSVLAILTRHSRLTVYIHSASILITQCSHGYPTCMSLCLCSCVLTFLPIREHAPLHLRKKPIWEPGERTLAEEHHTLETNLRPCGQVSVGWKTTGVRPVPEKQCPMGS